MENEMSSLENVQCGDCPMCDQNMTIPQLLLHAIVCQGLNGNGGSGLVVNPGDAQSK